MNEGLNFVVFGANGMLAQDLLEMFDYNENFYARGYSHEQCDISDKDDLWNCLGGTNGSITHVINCAGYTNVDGCESNGELAYKVNDEAVKNLAEICLDNRIHLTHISTDYVFEGLSNKPYI